MKMVIVLVLVALSAGASAQQMGWEEQQQPGMMGLYGGLNACAEFLRQQQCSSSPYLLMWQPSICQPLRQQCCMQLRQMEPQTRCQAMCAVVQNVVQGAIGGSSLYEPQQSPMAVAQMAQNLPAMCGLYQLPSYCTHPCAIAAGGYH